MHDVLVELGLFFLTRRERRHVGGGKVWSNTRSNTRSDTRSDRRCGPTGVNVKNQEFPSLLRSFCFGFFFFFDHFDLLVLHIHINYYRIYRHICVYIYKYTHIKIYIDTYINIYAYINIYNIL